MRAYKLIAHHLNCRQAVAEALEDGVKLTLPKAKELMER